MGRRFAKYFLPAALSVLAVLSAINAFLVMERERRPARPEGVPADLAKVWEAYSTIQRRYVRQGEIDPQKLADGAVRGMVDALDDPFASYFDAKQYEFQVENSLKGEFEGIGATVEMVDGRVTISHPLPGSPAEKAGLAAGDAILKVGGNTVEDLSVYEVVQLIRGPKDTLVTVTVQSGSNGAVKDHTLTRASLQFPTVASKMLEDGIAWVKISQFAPQTTEELDRTLKELELQGARAMVLDLRNNLGGLLSTVVDVSSQFLNGGIILVEVDADGKRTELKVKDGGRFVRPPLVVLVNHFSASGSEVVAGAVQARGRGKLIGTHTFGKGVVNLPLQLKDGSGLYLPTAKWYTPDGKPIGAGGLAPDIEVNRTREELYAGLDPQLERALQELKAALGSS